MPKSTQQNHDLHQSSKIIKKYSNVWGDFKEDSGVAKINQMP